jgi:hypothetical protein
MKFNRLEDYLHNQFTHRQRDDTITSSRLKDAKKQENLHIKVVVIRWLWVKNQRVPQA